MMKTVLSALMVLVSVATPLAQTASPMRSGVTAFIAVNVVPMDRDHILLNQTVLIEDGKIMAIGTSIRVPADARVIDGHGSAFLSPGLADMHTHSDSCGWHAAI
jgi:imidazolonepropionase-like amidohydrolase